MRTIKFRAWHKADEEMYQVYGFSRSQWFLRGKRFPMPTGAIELMQYTGLKDKNGKEIYEGDVVKTHDQNNVIKYQHGSFMLIGLHEDRYERNYSRLYHYLIDSTIPNMEGSKFDGVTTTLEIVGNIYEHPHLLEESE